MKKPIVAALSAAFSFAACEGERPPPPAPRVTAVAVTPTPVARAAAVPDSGVPFVKVAPSAPPDALALAHDTPGVDHLERARSLLKGRDPSGALTEARRALFSSPADEEALEFIGTVARRAGHPALAAEALGRLAQRQPADAILSLKQARALLQAKDFAGAIAAGQEAGRRDPGNPEAFQVTGLAQLSSGDLRGAITSFRTVIALQPDHGYAKNNLGLAYLRANENGAAVEILEEAVTHLPTVAWVHNNLGVAYERVGRSDDAKHAYQVAMDLSPKYVKARLNSARVAQRALDAVAGPDDSMSDVPHPLPEAGPTP